MVFTKNCIEWFFYLCMEGLIIMKIIKCMDVNFEIYVYFLN